MKRCLTAICLFLIILMPLMADNQVVESSRARQLGGLNTAVYEASVQSYADQLGLSSLPKNTISSGDYDDIRSSRVLYAMGDSSYPINAGDTYRLAYRENSTAIVHDLQVSSSYTINVPRIGSFDLKGKSYVEFKKEIEDAVSALYPYSDPVFTLTSTGVFPVFLSGEVASSGYASFWGLSRLSDAAVYASNTASTRRITVVDKDGNKTDYDLYKALREGVEGENPLLKEGDQVIFNKRGTQVSVIGNVERPGTYQITEGDDLDSLLDDYAKGTNQKAGDIVIRRFEDGKYTESVVLKGEGVTLKDGDVVVVKNLEVLLGSVTLEGALVSSSNNNTFVQGSVNSRYFYRYAEGDSLLDMLSDMDAYFIPASDLEGSYLIRNGESIPINISDILYGKDEDLASMPLQNGDRIVIPFNQLIVTVNGAVNSAGNYGYVPGRTASYYINLAGGFSSSAKDSKSYTVYNKYGEKLEDDAIVPAEAVVKVDVSTFSRDLTTAVSIIGIVTSVLAIITSTVKLATNNI